MFNAASMYGMFPNIYNNQVALNDLTGLDLYSPTGMVIDPMLTMQGSIFQNPMMYGNSIMPNPMFGCGYGNFEDYYKQYEKYQDFMIDSNVRQQQKMRNADLRLNSSVEGIQAKAALLHDKILSNEQEQIKLAYNQFIESVRNMYGDASETEVRNRANSLYAQLNGGRTLIDDIRANGRDSFTQGFLQTVTLGLADSKTAEENISELTGQPVGRSEKFKKGAGNVVGGALFGGGAFMLSNWALKAAKVASKSRTAWGIAIGSIVGLITAFATSKS